MKASLFSFAALLLISPSLLFAEGEVVFTEDFENGIDNWQVLDPETWKVSEKDGNHTFEILERGSAYKPPFRSPWHVALVKDVEVGDFDLTMRVRSTLDTGLHRDCCIYFGYQNPQQFYYAHLGAKPDETSGQILIVNNAARNRMTRNETPVPWDDKWHTVKVERRVEAGTIKVYFDDMETPIMEHTDTTFGKGLVGIGSFDDLDEFDDIKLVVPSAE
ncbi:hypothetical protein Mal64_14240 [Pseudobythopirellula maris]|uniref:3-keto-disaccharide hydrolase domain-containing protein n=1 Tax=Pseudobythopirellula maris TaxID=2527991 RepID=A0A5C5ZV78_9BACT|nr:hypothetical protein [Pseudobythopirellula maris]TWT91025.1 hypothetical protein Mal64_14240 [Pseudobythopirellula maris]